MPTAYPAALDTYGDPTGSQIMGLTTPTHSGHHTNHNDAIEAIEAKLGITPTAGDSLPSILIGDGTGKSAWSSVDAIPTSAIINSNMDHWQRNTGTITSTTTFNRLTSFGPDRFYCLPAGASVTQARSTTVPPSSPRSLYSDLITGATSVTTVDFGQRIRQALVKARCQQSMVFSAWVQNNTGAAFTPNLRVQTPAAVDSWGTPTNRLDQALQSCPDTAWTRVWAVFDPSAYTNLGNGLEALLRIPSGSLNAGTKSVRIAAMDLRPGSVLLPYVPPDPEIERYRCLEYAEVFGGVDPFEAACTGYAINTTQAYLILLYGWKWKAPTISVSAVGDWALTNAAGNQNNAFTSLVFSNSSSRAALSPAGSNALATGLTAGVGTNMLANNTTSARLYIIAELE